MADDEGASATRRTVQSGAPWEDDYGYARAVRQGRAIAVAGTCADGPYARLGSAEEAYRQAQRAFEKILLALRELEAGPEHVIRTRMFVVDIVRDGAAVGRAHREFIGKFRPAASMLEVSRLVDKKLLVEIEADAFV